MALNMSYAVLSYVPILYLFFTMKKNRMKNQDKNSIEGYLQSFIFGACVYAVFDLTNLALFKKYEMKVALQDILWGGTLFALTDVFNSNI